MSQIIKQNRTWVLMSQLRDNTTKEDLEKITPSIIELVDKWQSKGKFIWSGPLSDEKTGMAIFEATEEEAQEFHEEYGRICSEMLDHSLYQWESIPFLSML
ncbi:MAG: hypothetical protein KGI02_06410 [Thaumarchaeota archaeon]|nr:hypothetical protein [Nitrososphaerota archaeon]MDE1831986.1 hypothetical protein [Nitrososphaerota archaeon]MDE1841514.1 hypothetical protein [Nitrososphaerota archaeon]MDE1878896.1 hypothetical protein [Nitrososphaerota archaeon]